MSSKVATASYTSQRDSLADVRPHQVKADLPRQVEASELPELTIHAIRRAYGKVLTAAAKLEMHEASLGRAVKEGDLKLKQLATLGPKTLAELGKVLVETYGPMADSPEHQADKQIDRILEAANELRQYIESRRIA